MSYHGLPLGVRFKSINIWSEIVESMEKSLTRWNRMYLSIKSTVSNLTNFLSLFSITDVVANTLERIQKNFFGEVWGRRGNFIWLIGELFTLL